MTQMLNFQVRTLNHLEYMIRVLNKKMVIMNEHMENLNKEIEPIKIKWK